jgi:hypothetical protein
VREFLCFCRGRSTLRAFAGEEGRLQFEADKDGVKVEIYTDTKTDDTSKADLPTASTCARTLELPVYTKEEHFVEKLEAAMKSYHAEEQNHGGASFGYA